MHKISPECLDRPFSAKFQKNPSYVVSNRKKGVVFGLVWFFSYFGRNPSLRTLWSANPSLRTFSEPFWSLLAANPNVEAISEPGRCNLANLHRNLAPDGSRRYRHAPGRSPAPHPPLPCSKLAHCRLQTYLGPQIAPRSARKVPKSRPFT